VWERRARPRARIAAVCASLALLAVPASVVAERSHETHRERVAGAQIESSRTRADPDDFAMPDTTVDVGDGVETVIAPPPETFDAPPAPPAAPPVALHATGIPNAGGVWAVIIGIDDYPGSRSDLRASVADANEVDAALGGYGVPSSRRLLLRNTQASAGTISDSLRWLVEHASADATVVFFYAGHVRKLNSRTEAIVGADGRLVTDASMASLLGPLAARKVWIGMASCYGGGFTEVLAPGRILTGAADANSLAYENSSYGHSYLVEYMVHRAMNQGQAAGSIEQSFAWARAALQREYPNRVPVEYDQLDGELSLGTPPPRAATPAPPPPRGGGGGQAPPQPGPSDPPPKDDDPCVLRVGAILGCD
jgi:hypothetical protein